MAYKQKSPASVSEGSTGQSSYLDGQLLIGNSTGNTLDKSTLTAGTGVTILNAGGSITLSASGSAALSFPTDSGTAVPAANAITIAGGTGINTSGAGATATINLDSPVLVANGGTGATTLTGVLTGNGTSAVTANTVTQYGTVIAGASNAVSSVAPSATSGVPLISQGASANPVYGTAVVAGGGTGSTSFTAGSVVFSNGTILTQDNSNLFWDDSNNRLGINDATPLHALEVSGHVGITETATSTDEHTLELTCDAAGFGDFKGIDIIYTTGAIAAGSEDAIILINIDETSATGGEIFGLEVLSTREGTDVVGGLKTGIGVDAVTQEAGTFGDIDNILNKAVDVTAALAHGGAGNITMFAADDDTITMGDAAIWDETEVIIDTGASGGGIAPVFAFSTGGVGFTNFVPVDGTNGFRNTGIIDWNSGDLSGWATNASGLFEIRITRTKNSLSTVPIVDELQLGAETTFKWDKSGDVNLNSLTLATDLAVAEGGTGASTLTDGGVLLGSGTGAITALGQATNGQLVVGSTGADPVLATITAGTDISITNAAGSITINSTATGGGWVEETGTTRALVVNENVVGNNASLITMTLPTTAAFGSKIRIAGKGAGAWKIAQNASESIIFGTSTTTVGVGGSLQATEVADCIELLCTTADTTWTVLSVIGNITIV